MEDRKMSKLDKLQNEVNKLFNDIKGATETLKDHPEALSIYISDRRKEINELWSELKKITG